MKIFTKTAFLCLVIALSGCGQRHRESFDGRTLTGYEPMQNIDPSKPDSKWFHMTKLTFRKDSVFIVQTPVYVFNSDTTYSESDGGFYNYKGTFEDNGHFVIDAIETGCDYCPELMSTGKNGKLQRVYRHKTYDGSRITGGLQLNGVVFR
ncbi:hypothetical protein [Flavobacterium pallidum]|uniref:Uncharacterized protein n=1 Tax=Flavobacterium pallidum TaxID=2172098 RepID=A0A2S1SFE5_9FLAO|nr:hypothetical protein [Flavobacterium pallidum]AWI25124.1 hypothetical protein HYN49_04015 [Flavobacterium pallidum]